MVFKSKKSGVKKRVYRRKRVGASKTTIAKLSKQVRNIRAMMPVPEKKRFNFNVTDAAVGQCNGNLNAFYVLDVTPIPAQGNTQFTRDGAMIQLRSSYMKFQFQSAAASVPDYKIKIMLIKVIGQPYSSGTQVVANMFEHNSFVTGASIYDYYSDRDPEYFKSFRIVRQKTLTLKANQITNVPAIVTAGMGVKYKSHNIRFSADGTTSVSEGQLFLVVFVNNGNISGSTASTLGGTVSTAAGTGLLMQHDITHYYTDV